MPYKPLRAAIAFIGIILFLIAPTHATASIISGRVVSIADGDTITILAAGNIQTKIRLYGIDCPEKTQAFGDKAKKFTSSLVGGKNVAITAYDIDKYGRTVGIVYAEEINVNEQIIKAGLAWQYRKYCKEQFCEDWILLETEARNSGIGLWQESSPIPPWDWRKGIGTQTLSDIGGMYHGNQKSHVFHKSSCKVFNCKNCVIVFESRDEAIKAGFRPCGICRP